MRKFVSICFLLLGFFLIFSPQIEKKVSDSKQDQLIEVFENLGNTSVYEETESPVEVRENADEEKLTLLNGARGIVRIPAIELEMMIFEGSNESSLTKGIGMIEPDKQFGVNNVGLAGHRSTTSGKQFNRLDELGLQDLIEVQTESGTYEYEVIETFVVDQKEVHVLDDQKDSMLTLVTCTPLGKKNPTDRLIVQAKLRK